ncbi:MAG: rfaE [Gemmatimonadetes bacterium]|nr:rfaE [Gemmatimonadota bacterium]
MRVSPRLGKGCAERGRSIDRLLDRPLPSPPMSLTLTRDRLATLLDLSRNKRIAIVGDAMLDVYLSGDVDRVSPEAPVPIVRVRERKHALGGASNVAQNVVALGCRCDLVAAVGNDRSAETLRVMLSGMGAGVGSLLVVDRPTTVKTRVVARSQQLLRVDEEDDADLGPADITKLLSVIEKAVAAADALVLEDYNKGVLVAEVIEFAIAQARTKGIPIVVDPKYRNFFAYRGATIFKPNRRELNAALGATVHVDDERSLPDVVRRLDVQNLLLTLGELGMVLVSAQGEVGRVPTVAREVYDVVGAGDTVTAYLAAMLAGGATAAEASVVANIAAGIEVGKLGAATVSGRELLEYVDAHALHH